MRELNRLVRLARDGKGVTPSDWDFVAARITELNHRWNDEVVQPLLVGTATAETLKVKQQVKNALDELLDLKGNSFFARAVVRDHHRWMQRLKDLIKPNKEMTRSAYWMSIYFPPSFGGRGAYYAYVDDDLHYRTDIRDFAAVTSGAGRDISLTAGLDLLSIQEELTRLWTEYPLRREKFSRVVLLAKEARRVDRAVCQKTPRAPLPKKEFRALVKRSS